jgi:hypothetical protein
MKKVFNGLLAAVALVASSSSFAVSNEMNRAGNRGG